MEEQAQPAPRAWVAPEAGVEPSATSATRTPEPPRQEEASRITPPAPVGPMTLSDVLDGAFTIIKRRPRAVIGAVAVVIVPVQVLVVWIQSLSSSPNSVDQSPFDVLYTLSAETDLATTVLVVAVSTASLFFVGGIVSTFVIAWYSGRDISSAEALRAAFSRTPAYLAAWALLFPLKAISYVMCIAPLAVVVTFFALTAPAMTIERIGPLAGIKRSAQLVARRFWRCLGIILLASLVEVVLQFALAAIPAVIAAFLPSPADWMVVAAGEAGAALIATTALVGVSVLLYIDLRARTEALDLELRATEAFGLPS